MKFIINKPDLMKAARAVSQVIDKKPTDAILSNLRVNVKGGRLQIMGSNGETTVTAVAPVTREAKDESTAMFLVDCKMFLDAFKELPEGEILVQVEEKKTAMNIAWSSGAGKASIPVAFNAKDYPAPVAIKKDAPQVTIAAGKLREALNGTVYAACEDDLRPMLAGVLFEFAKDSVNLVATDSHILVWHNAPIGKNTGGDNHQFVLHNAPAGILRTLLKDADEDVTISYSDRNVSFTCGQLRVTARLIEGRYPAYRSIFPKDNDCSLVVERESFIGALKRVSVSADQADRTVILSLNENGEVKVKASNRQRRSEGVEKISGVYSGKSFDIGMHSQLLQEILEKFDSEKIIIKMKEPTKAALIVPQTEDGKTEYEALIMPKMIA